MLFKNLVIYTFSKPFQTTKAEMEEALERRAFRHCGEAESVSGGFVHPFISTSTVRVHNHDQQWLIAMKKEEKILPVSVIRDAVQEKVEAIETEQQRQVFSKEKRVIKDDVIAQLLPRAFTKSNIAHMWLDLDNQRLVVNVSSFRQAEEATSLLRAALGSLPITPPECKHLPSSVMTGWMNNTPMPTGCAMTDTCELREMDTNGAVTRTHNDDLDSAFLTELLSESRVVSKLGMCWKDQFNFVLNEDLRVNSIRYSGLITESIDDYLDEHESSKGVADFIIMTGALAPFITAMLADFSSNNQERAA